MTVIVAGSELNLEISLLICQETLNIVALECQTRCDTHKQAVLLYLLASTHARLAVCAWRMFSIRELHKMPSLTFLLFIQYKRYSTINENIPN